MEIIIELSFCINFIINAFIIRLTGLFLKERARLWWLGAIIGAVIALILPLFHLSAIFTILIELFLASLLVAISFSFKKFKRFLIILASFIGITFIFGGGCYAFKEAFGQISLLCVLLVASIIDIVATMVLKWRNKTRIIDTFSYSVKFKLGEKEVEEEGYLDSGNMLYDPITKKPIILITYEVFSKFYQDINYLSAFLKNVDVNKLRNGHYIKINSIASGTNILVFTVDRLEVRKEDKVKSYDNVAIGLSFSGFEKGCGRQVLLHSELI